MKSRAIALIAILALAGCSGGAPCSFVEGAREFTDLVIPEYVRYLENDSEIDPGLLEMRLLLVEKWRQTLEDAEGLCAEAKPKP